MLFVEPLPAGTPATTEDNANSYLLPCGKEVIAFSRWKPTNSQVCRRHGHTSWIRFWTAGPFIIYYRFDIESHEEVIAGMSTKRTL